MKELEISVQVRNNLLKERRLGRGLSQVALGKLLGVSRQTINAAECFRFVSQRTMLKIADFFECHVADIFPEHFEAIKKSGFVLAKTDCIEISRLQGRIYNPLELTEKVGENAVIADSIEKQLQTLSNREAQIIRLRFGIGTGYPRNLGEVGKIMGASRERIRLFEAIAIRKLRHPTRSRILRDVSNYEIPIGEKKARKMAYEAKKNYAQAFR